MLHPQSLLAGATVAVQQQQQQPAKNASPYHPLLSPYTFVANKTLLWHLEFEIACMHRHVENRLWSFSFFQHFPLRSFWAKMPLRWTQSVWAGGLLPESTSTMVKLQCMSSWSGFPVVPDIYARVPSNSETHRRKTVFQSKNPQKKQNKFWTFAVSDLIWLINTRSFRSERCTKAMSVVFTIATLLSVSSSCSWSPSQTPTV